MKHLAILFFFSCISFVTPSVAAIATFDIIGADGSAFDGSGVGGQLTSDTGVVLTTTALAPSGTISINSSGMGINEASSGDAPSAFDDDNGAESWSFSFNMPIASLTLDLDALSASESFEISSPAFATVALNDDGNDIFTINQTVPSGTPVTLTVVSAGTEAALVALNVDTIPEPSGALLALLGTILLAFRRQRL